MKYKVMLESELCTEYDTVIANNCNTDRLGNLVFTDENNKTIRIIKPEHWVGVKEDV